MKLWMFDLELEFGFIIISYGSYLLEVIMNEQKGTDVCLALSEEGQSALPKDFSVATMSPIFRTYSLISLSKEVDTSLV